MTHSNLPPQESQQEIQGRVDLEPIKARAKAYFDGGWSYYPPDGDGWAEYVPAARHFYAEAAIDIPVLIGEVEDLRAQLALQASEIAALQQRVARWAIYCFNQHGNDAHLYNGLADLAGPEAMKRPTLSRSDPQEAP